MSLALKNCFVLRDGSLVVLKGREVESDRKKVIRHGFRDDNECCGVDTLVVENVENDPSDTKGLLPYRIRHIVIKMVLDVVHFG